MTVDVSHALATAGDSQEQLYVAATRGRDANHIWVAIDSSRDQVRHDQDPPTAERILSGILNRRDPQWPALVAKVRQLALAGHDQQQLLPRIVQAPLGDVHSAAGVLHWRLDDATSTAAPVRRGGCRRPSPRSTTTTPHSPDIDQHLARTLHRLDNDQLDRLESHQQHILDTMPTFDPEQLDQAHRSQHRIERQRRTTTDPTDVTRLQQLLDDAQRDVTRLEHAASEHVRWRRNTARATDTLRQIRLVKQQRTRQRRRQLSAGRR